RSAYRPRPQPRSAAPRITSAPPPTPTAAEPDATPLPLGPRRARDGRLSRPRVGRSAPTGPTPVRAPHPRGRAGGAELGHRAPEAERIPPGLRGIRPEAGGALHARRRLASPPRSGNHPAPRQDRKRGRERARLPRDPA